MRNRTAIRIVYGLAILGGLLPPLLFVAYAYLQSVARIERELEFVSGGVVTRADEMLGSITASLREVAANTENLSDERAVSALREVVFRNRFLQAIVIIRDGHLVATSESILEEPQLLSEPELAALPAIGEISIQPPLGTGFAPDSLTVSFRSNATTVIEGVSDPRLLTEFLAYYAERSGVRVSVYLGNGRPLTSFGPESISMPPWIESGSPAANFRWHGDSLVEWRSSSLHPISAVAVSASGAVTRHLIQTGLVFAAAGIVLSALIVGLLIRIANRTRSLEADLREAIRFGELDVFYQPIIDLRTGRCAGAEALMRWHHPHRGVIPAGEFITVAETSGLILPMTDLMLGKIARDLRNLFATDPTLHIGINLAPQHFASDHILQSASSQLHVAIAPSQIIYEITERGLVSDRGSAARRVMNGLLQHGSKLAVDDFGTGYSSLSYLERFPLDYLKIDKAFVDGISDAESSSGLVDQVIRIGQSLGMAIIAEGVEHDYQADYLRTHGVEFAQGWFFARPLPAPEFHRLVREKNAPVSHELPRV